MSGNSQNIIDLYIPSAFSSNSYVSIKNSDFDASFDLSISLPLRSTADVKRWYYSSEDSVVATFEPNDGLFTFDLGYETVYNNASLPPVKQTVRNKDNLGVMTYNITDNTIDDTNPLGDPLEVLSTQDLLQRFLVWRLLDKPPYRVDEETTADIINTDNSFNDLFSDEVIDKINVELGDFMNNYVNNSNLTNEVTYKNKLYAVMRIFSPDTDLDISKSIENMIDETLVKLGGVAIFSTTPGSSVKSSYNWVTFSRYIDSVDFTDPPDDKTSAFQDVIDVLKSVYIKPKLIDGTTYELSQAVRLHLDLSIGINYSSRYILNSSQFKTIGAMDKSYIDKNISSSKDDDSIHLELILVLNPGV